MTSNEHYRISDASEYPTLPPEEVGLRVLKLLGELPSLKRVTAQQVIEKPGFPLGWLQQPAFMGLRFACLIRDGSTW